MALYQVSIGIKINNIKLKLMKNTIYKIAIFVLGVFTIVSCESPEAETNYTPAEYEFPSGITLTTNNVTINSFNLSYSNTGMGEGYYVVVEGGSETPTTYDVLAGEAAGLIMSGNFELTGSDISTTIDDLCIGLSYDVYAVHFTSDSFLSEDLVSINVSTSAKAIEGTYTGIPTAFGSDFSPFTATLTATGNANEFTIDTSWGTEFIAELAGNPDYIGVFNYSGTLTIDMDNYSVTIVGDDAWATGGDGYYDPCTHEISYNLTQALFGNPFTTDVVLTQD